MISRFCRLIITPQATLALCGILFGPSAVRLLHGQSVHSQSRISAGPGFEVATIKPSNFSHPGPMGVYAKADGVVYGGFTTVRMLMMVAYDVHPFQITGGPRWIDSDRFDFVAKGTPAPDGTSTVSTYSTLTSQQKLMLQKLLADRFELKVHHEQRPGQIFVLKKRKDSTSLRATSDSSQPPWVGSIAGGAINGDGIKGENITMDLLSQRLGRFVGHPVINQTGLIGSFDFKYDYNSGESPTDPNDYFVSIVESLKGIGLDLRPSRGMVDTIVIDSVSKPTPN